MPSGKLRHNRDYLRYRAARVTSILGSQVSWIAYPLLVLSLGGRAVQAGAVASCSLITLVICRLPGGHAADRFDRRKLMVAADAVRFIAVGTIPVAAAWHALTFPQLLAVAAVESSASAVFGPAATSILRDLLPADQITRALSQTQASSAALSLVGPVLGGFLFGLDRMLPFVVDAASYGVSATLLVGLPARSPRPAGNRDRRMTAGLRWLRARPDVMRVLIFVSVLNLAGSAASVAVVVALRDSATPSTVIGLVLSCAAVGSIAGSSLARKITERLDPARLCLAVGAIWSAGLATLAVASSPWSVGPVLACMFLCVPAAAIMLAATSLGDAPRDLIGRISTAQQMITSSLSMLGPLLAGASLQAIGLMPMWLLLAGCCLAATVFVAAPLILQWRPAGPGSDEVHGPVPADAQADGS